MSDKKATANYALRNTHYIFLGSGQAAGLGIGNKGALLDRAAQAGLPVPKGLILLDSAWRHALTAGLVTLQDRRMLTSTVSGTFSNGNKPASCRNQTMRS